MFHISTTQYSMLQISKESLWIAGSLYFTQLHVLFFGYQSLVSGQTIMIIRYYVMYRNM